MSKDKNQNRQVEKLSIDLRSIIQREKAQGDQYFLSRDFEEFIHPHLSEPRKNHIKRLLIPVTVVVLSAAMILATLILFRPPTQNPLTMAQFIDTIQYFLIQPSDREIAPDKYLFSQGKTEIIHSRSGQSHAESTLDRPNGKSEVNFTMAITEILGRFPASKANPVVPPGFDRDSTLLKELKDLRKGNGFHRLLSSILDHYKEM